MKCIYCQAELFQLKQIQNYYFCASCFQKHLVAVLYSYDSWGDRFTSVYLDFYAKNSQIRVGIQPFLEKVHVCLYRDNYSGKVIRDSDKLIINIEGKAMHVMLHPHYSLSNNIEIEFPLNTILSPCNIHNKISLYLLFS